MKFLLDENVDYRLVAFFQHHHHDVTAIAVTTPLACQMMQCWKLPTPNKVF